MFIYYFHICVHKYICLNFCLMRFYVIFYLCALGKMKSIFYTAVVKERTVYKMLSLVPGTYYQY